MDKLTITKSPEANLLEHPFTDKQIKQRPGQGGQVDYVEGATVIKRLNDVFGHDGWQFEILEHLIGDTTNKKGNPVKEVVVKGRLTIVNELQFEAMKEQFGSPPGQQDNLGDQLKSAATDCLKKCASLLGIGLHLYGDHLQSFEDDSEPIEIKQEEGANPEKTIKDVADAFLGKKPFKDIMWDQHQRIGLSRFYAVIQARGIEVFSQEKLKGDERFLLVVEKITDRDIQKLIYKDLDSQEDSDWNKGL